MKSDTSYKLKYHEKIQDYIKKGYVKKWSEKEVQSISENIWYLPHFGTSTPSKPKLRFILDAKAPYQGISLTNMLMKGPDLYNSLVGVLYKFRQGQYAAVGDIMEMFHMIRIRDEDKRFQCFLWRDSEAQKTPDIYQMQVMIFGATCSPCSAQYVKNLNASSYKDKFPRAVHAIQNNFCIDDYMDSFATAEEAKNVTQQVIDINKEGGFNLRSILSNVSDIVACEELKSGAMNLSFEQKDEFPTEKVLGIQWNIIEDILTYKFGFRKVPNDIMNMKRPPTKREFLKMLMSVYDPLGLINHYVVRAKKIMQAICAHEDVGWSDAIPSDLNERWQEWWSGLQLVKSIRIPRCYSKSLLSATEIQLCMFGDASKEIYACCAYFRIIQGDSISVAFIGGKTKVASRKVVEQQSIPRMELMAAVIATRFAKTIIKEHSVTINKVFMFSDSETVLKWLKMIYGQLKPFVASRIVEIHETQPANATYVPSALNSADEVTKVTKHEPFDQNNKWFTGPQFLKQKTEE